MFKKPDIEVLEELYAAPVKDYVVTFKYHSVEDPSKIETLINQMIYDTYRKYK